MAERAPHAPHAPPFSRRPRSGRGGAAGLPEARVRYGSSDRPEPTDRGATEDSASLPPAGIGGTRRGRWIDGSWRLADDPSPEVLSGPGTFDMLGAMAARLGFRRTLVAADRGVASSGIAGRALASLRAAGVNAAGFHDFGADPKESDVARGAAVARRFGADSLVGVGGGSSMDAAKGIGFLLAAGGRMEDWRGFDRAPAALPPMIGVPATAGTGSEAQSYALVSRDSDGAKMACGAPSAMFRAVILDPSLPGSAPRAVAAAAGFDAIAHAVESAVSTRRSRRSLQLSLRAFGLLARAFPLRFRERGGGPPGAVDTDLQIGAFLAGAAIERSMLGAAHALANPLTRRYGLPHGVALAITLPEVVRWNGDGSEEARATYRALLSAGGFDPGSVPPSRALAARLEGWIRLAGLPRDFYEAGVAGRMDANGLSEEAAREWTGTFNPRRLGIREAEVLYERCAGA